MKKIYEGGVINTVRGSSIITPRRVKPVGGKKAFSPLTPEILGNRTPSNFYKLFDILNDVHHQLHQFLHGPEGVQHEHPLPQETS